MKGTASGFVIEDGTTLVTNYHVIEDAYHIVAWTPDGGKSVDVSNIIVYDEDYIYFYNHQRIQLKTGVAPLTLRHSA